MISKTFLIAAAALTLAGCIHDRPRDGFGRDNGPAPGAALLKYDANHDGKVTRAELIAGLRAEFAAADTNHDGCLQPAEVLAVNEARWAADHSASPLVDWAHKGCIDFNGYAAEPLSLFDQLDVNNDGVLTADELKGGRAGPENAPKEKGQSRGRRGGRRGGPDGGPGPGGGDSDGDGG